MYRGLELAYLIPEDFYVQLPLEVLLYCSTIAIPLSYSSPSQEGEGRKDTRQGRGEIKEKNEGRGIERETVMVPVDRTSNDNYT